jgi:hypothetical protein
MKHVEFFEELNKEDVAIAGGKGANLGELTQAGIPVPPGFVIRLNIKVLNVALLGPIKYPIAVGPVLFGS